MTHVTCMLNAKNRDKLRNPIRSVIEYGLPLPFKNKQQLDENLRSVNGGRRRCDLERGLSSYIQRAESMATDRSELFEVSLDVGGARRC